MSETRPMTESGLAHAESEAVAGRLWRAKEILAGNIGSHGYSPERFAAYGRILARMHDTKEAGKYLLLSGLADEAEAPIVEVFLDSVRDRPHKWIYSQFPGIARRNALADFPERVREELVQLGFPRDFRRKGSPATSVPAGRWQVLGVIVVGLFVFLVVNGLLHGCHVVGGWIFGP